MNIRICAGQRLAAFATAWRSVRRSSGDLRAQPTKAARLCLSACLLYTSIYEGPNQNLVGIKTFSGSAGNQSPQHAVLLGMSGAGKSVTICDLLSQTENYFAYTVIIAVSYTHLSGH